MRKLASLFVLLLLSAPVWPQGITVKGGDAKIIEVDQWTVTKIKRTLVTKFPFTLTAPTGGFGYWWEFPESVKAKANEEDLTITAAPKGDLTVSVIVKTVDFDAKKVTKQEFVLILAVGEISPTPVPPKPDPIPVPVPIPTALEKSLGDAYAADLDPDKAKHVATFADLLANLVPAAKASGNVKTLKDFTTKAHAATDIAIGPTAILKVRTAVATYLSSTLPRDPNAAFDESYINHAEAEHKLVASALKGLVK